MGIVVHFEVSSCVATLCCLGFGERYELPNDSMLSHALLCVKDDLPLEVQAKISVDSSGVLLTCTQMPQVIRDLRKMGMVKNTHTGRVLELAERDAYTIAAELGFENHHRAAVVADKFCSVLKI